MAAKNLWGELPQEVTIRTPYSIFKEQASALTDTSKGVLVGEATKDSISKNTIRARLTITAPAFNNYNLSVASSDYPLLETYPCNLTDHVVGKSYSSIESEQLLERVLAEVLTSEALRKILRSLISQSLSPDEK